MKRENKQVWRGGAEQVGKMGEDSREGAEISNMEHEKKTTKALQKPYKNLKC